MNDEGSALDRLVARVPDEALRTRISREVELLRDARRFGLVFDRHLPETVRLPGFPVRVGVTVGLRDESSDEQWTVVGIDGAVARLHDETTKPVDDLVVVREFGDPVLPGLRVVERHGDHLGAPRHVVINGENLHALQLLRETHRGLVDLIYIDPPYNTGNDGWIYNDRYVDASDRAKSSKWLSFMERRLQVAYDLLTPTGVIIVAIGDDEHHRLRMLLDQVFGPTNFISDVVWQGGRKNDSRYVSNGADYMLIYARDESALADRGIRWREEKPGVHEVLAQGAEAWAQSGGDEKVATAAMRRWFKAQPKDSPVLAMARYVYFLPDGRLCRDSDIGWPGGGGPRYEVLHPDTGRPVPVPRDGWRFSTPERMKEAIEGGWIVFREDHTKPISRKVSLADIQGQVALSVFDRQRTHSGRHLGRILGDSRFPFPKDHTILMRWIRMAAPKDALVLDFFGGSGSTTEAVLRLNAEDGGTRQSILVTNNEVGPKVARRLRKDGHHPGDAAWSEAGVFEHVTRPRITTLVTGVRPDGTAYDDAVEANVDFLDLVYLDPGRTRVGLEFPAIAPVLWLEAGGVGRCIDEDPGTGWDVGDTYAVLFESDTYRALHDALESRAGVRTVYVATDSPAEARAIAAGLPATVDVVRLYDDFLRTYGGVES